jgi:hypothetical protein
LAQIEKTSEGISSSNSKCNLKISLSGSTCFPYTLSILNLQNTRIMLIHQVTAIRRWQKQNNICLHKF